jgi:hypothetical protein
MVRALQSTSDRVGLVFGMDGPGKPFSSTLLALLLAQQGRAA